MLSTLIHNSAVLAGVILTAIGLGGRAPIITGIALIILGLILK